MTTLTRRRFLTISAAAVALPAQAATVPMANWSGIALGAPASLQIAGLTTEQAAPVFTKIEGELSRLEQVFSLYKNGSELSRLNSNGILKAPSPDMLAVLSLAGAIHAATNGAFDPTVQPLWQKSVGMQSPDSTTGWQHLRFDSSAVTFAAPNGAQMGLTLNGIAQGYVTDQIAAVLHDAGLRDVLVDMGEILAKGSPAPGRDWYVGIAAPEGQVVERLTLSDRALATSAPFVPNAGGQMTGPHILPPTPRHKVQQTLVSISAPTAVLADGLSTACCLLSASQINQALSHFPNTQIETRQELS
ncbi:FAD:protein FMN transferase [Parasedimentitalea maritima]|uniref:FAD:protein FMN transferase n=1 Tax=Parasedimentitalea maritima TaxID=2578117 RepID=A0ABY2URX4_9RHOB|nr:FAD:protein FMN transferase [Zongyanglinia marina]TLP59383.1 FAD:protein FMN transferase [Zongyanglinia marina]